MVETNESAGGVFPSKYLSAGLISTSRKWQYHGLSKFYWCRWRRKDIFRRVAVNSTLVSRWSVSYTADFLAWKMSARIKFLVIVKYTFCIKFKQSSFINQCKELIPFINEAVICVCRRLIYILLHLWTQPHLRVLETHPTNSSTDDGLFSFSDITF